VLLDQTSWDQVPEYVRARLRELGWDARKRSAQEILGVNEHLTAALLGTQEPRGCPESSTLERVSRRLGWAPDGLERILAGDSHGATVIDPDPPSSYRDARQEPADPSLEFRVASLERAVRELLLALRRLEDQTRRGS
jgi:hypothetical protein